VASCYEMKNRGYVVASTGNGQYALYYARFDFGKHYKGYDAKKPIFVAESKYACLKHAKEDAVKAREDPWIIKIHRVRDGD
jgi:hypothetical protein